MESKLDPGGFSLRTSVEDDPAQGGLVDAHAEGHGGHDHLKLVEPKPSKENKHKKQTKRSRMHPRRHVKDKIQPGAKARATGRCDEHRKSLHDRKQYHRRRPDTTHDMT